MTRCFLFLNQTPNPRRRNDMTLNQILKIESVLTNRSVPKDIEKLVKLSRYSQSLEKNQRIGDLNIINVLRVLRKEAI